MELTSVIDIVKSNALGCNNKFKVTDKQGNTSIRRLFVCDNSIAEYKKNSKKCGHRLYGDWIDWNQVVPVMGLSGYDMFHRNTTKAAQLLANSGMWPVMQRQMAALASLDIASYNELMEIYNQWHRSFEDDLQNKFRDYFTSRMLEPADIYHFKQLSNKGQIITVPYDSYFKQVYIEDLNGIIAKAKSDDEPINTKSFSWRGSYDYSIEIRKDKDGVLKGWYSAEYKNCGNGHYYLLLDASHAIYYEDD